VWRYKELIAGEYKKIVTLNEGNTPLIKSLVMKMLTSSLKELTRLGVLRTGE
jgi:hypothetical protein